SPWMRIRFWSGSPLRPKSVSFRRIPLPPTDAPGLKRSRGRPAKVWRLKPCPYVERVGEFDDEATRGLSASHHLQVKAALALLYHVLGSTNPSPSAGNSPLWA